MTQRPKSLPLHQRANRPGGGGNRRIDSSLSYVNPLDDSDIYDDLYITHDFVVKDARQDLADLPKRGGIQSIDLIDYWSPGGPNVPQDRQIDTDPHYERNKTLPYNVQSRSPTVPSEPQGRRSMSDAENNATAQLLAARIEFAQRLSLLKDEFVPRIGVEAVGEELANARQKDEPFAIRLARMNMKDRRKALKKHYSESEPWLKARGDDPKPEEYLEWLDTNFPDRRDVGLLYGDMQYIDREAFLKLKNWRASTDPKIMAAISQFGLPTKQGSYDPESALKEAPTSRQVRDAYLQGDPDAPKLERQLGRAKYHTLG
jgi:hypothetical protein